jgi:hypothetical protein
MTERLLNPKTTQIQQNNGDIVLTTEGHAEPIDQIVRCFPFSTPNNWISFRKTDGSEMGLLKTIDELDKDSRLIVETRLKDRYYIPTILRIVQIETDTQGTQWQVDTAEGIKTFSLRGERGVSTSEFPKIVLTDATSRQRFVIPDYTALDRTCQHLARAHLPISSRRGRGGRFR